MMKPVTIHGVRLGIDTLVYCGSFVVVGFQAVLFSQLSRIYAVQEGLYPKKNFERSLSGKITMEAGLAIGLLIFLAGFAAAIFALFSWKQHGFGELETEHIARLVIPSSIGMSLGIEIILSSFLMSTLELGVRHQVAGPLKEYSPGAAARTPTLSSSATAEAGIIV